MNAFLLRYRRVAVVVATAASMGAAYFLAYLVRFEFSPPATELFRFLRTLPLLLVAKMTAFLYFRLFQGWWRYVTVRDAEEILKASVLGTVGFTLLLVATYQIAGMSRAVLVLDLGFCVALIAGSRLAVRIVRERGQRLRRKVEKFVLIVGAGEAGVQLLHEIQTNSRLPLQVIGFVDDNPAKQGERIGGMPVVGMTDPLPTLVKRYGVDEIILAIPSAVGRDLRRIVERCQASGVPYRILPPLGQFVTGQTALKQVREVRMEDLLGRLTLKLEVERIRRRLAGRTVLVTGAAGSIGSELCRQILPYGARKLIGLDQNENGLFLLEHGLRRQFPDASISVAVGDILDESRMDEVFARFRPQAVYHAAAYKHVPLLEANILEAARNNVLGTRTVALSAVAHGVEDFVLVSTDKAVSPRSVMGVTKRLAELVIRDMQGDGTRFVGVRFGNVLGTSGSVVPLFVQQIAEGGPVTVTHPEATRYFMTVQEAAQLILQAAAMGQGGEIFVLNMGEPILIADLARNLIRLHGLEPDEDIKIVFTGLRPGEKLHEELVEPDEETTSTYFDKIRVVSGKRKPVDGLAEGIAALEEAVRRSDVRLALATLVRSVPTFEPGPHLAALLRRSEP